jgi:hypothetical protein
MDYLAKHPLRKKDTISIFAFYLGKRLVVRFFELLEASWNIFQSMFDIVNSSLAVERIQVKFCKEKPMQRGLLELRSRV